MSLFKIFMAPLSSQIRFALTNIARGKLDNLNKLEYQLDMPDDEWVSLSMYGDQFRISSEADSAFKKFKGTMNRLRRGDLHAAAASRYSEETADRITRIIDPQFTQFKHKPEHYELWRGEMINLADALERAGY